MKHEKHPWFIRDSNPVPLGQESGALTTELRTKAIKKLQEKFDEVGPASALSDTCFLVQNRSILNIGSGAPSSNDPKFERRLPGAPWPTFRKLNDAKLFLISILKALESLETFRSCLIGLILLTRKTGASGRFLETIRKTHIEASEKVT
jgi:hypothetical protein